MMTTWFFWIRLLADSITFLLVPGAIGLFKMLHRVRTNDLLHLEQSMSDLKDGIERIEDKIDRHLEWHLGDKK